MKVWLKILLLMAALVCQGCNADTFKRKVYEVFQNWGEQHCQKEPYRECPEPQNYDQYQRERNTIPND